MNLMVTVYMIQTSLNRINRINKINRIKKNEEKIRAREGDNNDDSDNNWSDSHLCTRRRELDNMTEFKLYLNCNSCCVSSQCPSCSGLCMDCHSELTSFG